LEAALPRQVARAQRLVPDVPFGSIRGLARYVAVAGLAGLMTGIAVGGVGGRLFMRIAGAAAPRVAQGSGTEAGFTVGEVSVGGTIALVVFIGIFVGVVGAALFVASMPWLAWAGRWRGFLVGVVLFAAGSATSDVMNPDNFDFRILRNGPLLVGLILALFLAFGVVIDRLFVVLGRSVPQPGGHWRGVDGVFFGIAGLGLAIALSVLPILFTEAFCDCDPPLAASWSVIVMGVGTVLWWTSALVAGAATWLRFAAGVFGYTGLVGVVLLGLNRAVSDAIEIIG
jgi:hypothetical protein